MVKIVSTWSWYLVSSIFKPLAFARVKGASTAVFELGEEVCASFVHSKGHGVYLARTVTVAGAWYFLLFVSFDMSSFAEGICTLRQGGGNVVTTRSGVLVCTNDRQWSSALHLFTAFPKTEASVVFLRLVEECLDLIRVRWRSIRNTR